MREDRPVGYWMPREIAPGLWQIGPLTTGDGGKKLFDETVKKQMEEELKKYKIVEEKKIFPKSRNKIPTKAEIEKILKELFYGDVH